MGWKSSPSASDGDEYDDSISTHEFILVMSVNTTSSIAVTDLASPDLFLRLFV